VAIGDTTNRSHAGLRRLHKTRNRQVLNVLITHRNQNTVEQLRQTIKALGFGMVTYATSHYSAIHKLMERELDYILYDAADTDIPVLSFISQVRNIDEIVVLVALSSSPRVDDVFSQLRSGANHYLVLPFSGNSVEQVMMRALTGPPLSDAVLHADDRDSALAGLVVDNLDRLSVVKRQARDLEISQKTLERWNRKFKESVQLAKTFCEHGHDALLARLSLFEAKRGYFHS